jgi:DNA-binding transcriptional MerR regulator
LPAAGRSAGGHRRYGEQAMERLRLVRINDWRNG